MPEMPLELLSSAQMRGIEAAAMASGRVTGLELMERAGRAVVDAVFAHWPGMGVAGGHAVVLCGPGNNGGDGYVIARLLQGWGWRVAVHALADPMTPDAAEMRGRWGGEVLPLGGLTWEALAGRPLVVDAIFGTGLGRDIAPGVWGALAMAQEAGCPMVAVDILSGLCADSGRVRSASGYLDRPVDLTVTFQCSKTGHHLAEAADLGGALVVAPIGLEGELDDLLRREGEAVVDLASPGGDLGKAQGHKFSHGHAVVFGGGPGQGGAARLAARAALRVGAGLVTLACPPEAVPENAARLDAVMLRPVADAAGLGALLADARISALCLGPGMGVTDRSAGLVEAALCAERRLVLDADALTLLGRDAVLMAQLHWRCVLTPHGGEFARLFPDLAERLATPQATGALFSKLDATREAARRCGAVVLFKGADTVIAAPDGRAVISAAYGPRAAPWLATAGAGDVLAGIITGLLARGFSPFQAAETGAWLHVECARSFGPGLIAEDLPEQLPKVFHELGLS